MTTFVWFMMVLYGVESVLGLIVIGSGNSSNPIKDVLRLVYYLGIVGWCAYLIFIN